MTSGEEAPWSALLRPLIEEPEKSAVLVDFDGSLAPIVADPAAARPLPASVEALRRLTGRVGRLAVVSGRPISHLAEYLDLPGVDLVGLYGLERIEGGRIIVDPRAMPYVESVSEAARRVETAMPGLLVERKGGCSITLHWRRTPALGAAAASLGHRLALELGLEALPARMALELRPPVPLDKGTPVAHLAEGCAHALFAGDDSADADAFGVLGRMLAEGRLVTAVRVAVGSTEAPLELLELADAVVSGPVGLAALLADLADALAGEP